MGCETIYAFIYRAAQKAEQLWRYLIPFPQRAKSKGAGLPEERKWRAVFLGGSM